MMINNKALGFALAGLIVLPGCLHVPTYKAKSLKNLNDNFVYREIKNNIVFQAKCLTHGEIYYLFGEHTQALLETTEIVYCSIHNLSGQEYVLSLKNENFSPLPMGDIKKLIKTSSIDRLGSVPLFFMAGSGIALTTIGTITLASKGCAGLLTCPFFLWWYAGIWVVALGGLSSGMHTFFTTSILSCTVIPLVFFGKSIVMNHRISKDLKEKMLRCEEFIKSGDMREGLIFVKAPDYNHQFSVMMQEKNNSRNKIIFDVNLAANAKIMQ